MSQFEFIAIPVSLILTFGIARLLSGFPHVLVSGRAYWVHALWCGTALLNLFIYWWAFWAQRNVETWTLGSYLWTLLYPALCYVGATILVPTNAANETDWRTYFYRVRRPLFVAAGLSTATTLGTIAFVAALPISSLEFLVAAAFVGLYVVGYLNASERVQQFIVLLNLAAVAAAYAPLVY